MPEQSDHARAVQDLMEGERARQAAPTGSGAGPSGDKPTPAIEPILQYFRYEHLPEKLQSVSKPFGLLAQELVMTLPRNPERSVALRKLLEAKDAAVRAALTD